MEWDELVPVDGIEVSYRKEGWELVATWPQRGSKHEVITQLRVNWHGANPGIVMSTKRINILSMTAVNSVITAMNRKVGERQDEGIAQIVHTMCEDLMRWYREGKAISQPDPTRVVENSGWLVYPVWPAVGATAVAAAPGSYKSFMAEALALQLTSGYSVLHRNTSSRVERKVLYLDWEADADTFAQRLGAICRGAGIEEKAWLGYKQMSARLADVSIGLGEEIVRGGYEAAVIDSMSAAIGGGMVDDDSVNAFWDAIRTLGVPVLVVAHKSADNIAKRKARFFGSIMSEARVRMAWNAERSEGTPHVMWECFKDNNTGHIGSKVAWEVQFETFGEKETKTMSKVSFLGVNPANIMLTLEEEEKADRMSDQILNLLRENGPMMTSAIAARLKISTANVRAQLSRHSALFTKHGDMWAVAGETRPIPY